MGQGAAEWRLQKPFVLAVLGSSLTAGRLSGNLWWQRAMENIRAQPEAVGPVFMRNFGQGSAQSSYGVTRAPDIADYNPTHIISEGFAINDAAPALGVVTRAQHTANMQTMHDVWKAKNPAVSITWQTMNGVSAAGAILRPELALYYGDEITKALAMGDGILDHYTATNGYPVPPGRAGGWPKPLPESLTDLGDGLHPIWDFALEVYFWPAFIFRVRQLMAAHWELAAPFPPEPPALPEGQSLTLGGGGGGGGYVGAGGGAGGFRRAAVGSLLSMLGPVVVAQGGAAGAGSSGAGDGGKGGLSRLSGAPIVDGGGFGAGAYSRPGGDGASGGGSTLTQARGGLNITGQGFQGGTGISGSNAGQGGGGGAALAGGIGSGSAPGNGGAGRSIDVPGFEGLFVCAGGGASIYSGGVRFPYLAGGGPNSYGGGGQGGGGPNNTGPGEAGGPGCAWLWYEGPAQLVGGSVTTFGGFTVHQFARTFLPDAAPYMSGASEPAGHVATSSQEQALYPAWDLFAEWNTAEIAGGYSGWVTSSGGVPQWAKRRFTGVQRRWTQYRIMGQAPPWSTPTATLLSWIIQGSNDDTNWTDLDTRGPVPAWAASEVRAYTIANPGFYEYYRLYVTANGGAGNVQVCRWELGNFFPGAADFMQSNTTPAGNTASADGADASGPAWEAFSGLGPGDNSWVSANTALPHWLRRQWSTAKTWTHYTIRARDFAASPAVIANQQPRDWQIRGSNDGATWTLLDTQFGQGGWISGELRSFAIANPGAYTYYEMLITGVQSGNFAGVGQLAFTTALGPSPIYPHFMTAAATPTGYVAAADSEYDGNYPAWKAFIAPQPGVDFARWATTDSAFPHHITLTLPQPKRFVGYMTIETAAGAVVNEQQPKDWTVLGSNDGVTWNLLDTRANMPLAANEETRLLTFNGPFAGNAFRFYRWLITARQVSAARNIVSWRSLQLLPGLEAIAAPPATDPLFRFVRFLAPLDFVWGLSDVRGHPATVLGNSQINTAVEPLGAARFDGNGDYVQFPASTDYDLVGDFTLECWFYIAGNSNTNGDGNRPAEYFGCFPPSGTRTGYTNGLAGSTTTTGTFTGFTHPTTGVNAYGANPVSQLAWHHYAVARVGSAITVYLDGVAVGTATFAGAMPSSNTFKLAALANSGFAQELNGYLRDVRLTIGAARYTGNFTPPARGSLPTQ